MMETKKDKMNDQERLGQLKNLVMLASADEKITDSEMAVLTAVATRENRRMITVVQQQTDDIRRHGRLACSSYREITHTDSGRLDGEREQQTLVIQRVPNGYTERVKPAERNIENAAHLD